MVDNAKERLLARFRQIRERTPAPRRKPQRAAEPGLLPDSLLSQPLFGDLSQTEAALLGLFVRRESAEAGRVIVRQGEEGDAFYLIEAGEVEVRAHGDDGQETTIATLGPGRYFGEIALVTGGPRNADVVALTPTTLLRLDRSGYELLTQATATEQLRHTAQRRAAETQEKLGQGE